MSQPVHCPHCGARLYGVDILEKQCNNCHGKLKMDVVAKPFGPFCYTPDTEILTENGIKNVDELVIGESVATLNKETNELEYNPILNLEIFDYDGEMIHFNGKQHDLIITPNHNLYVRNQNSRWFSITAEELFERNTNNYEFKKDCVWTGTDADQFKIPEKFIPWSRELYDKVIEIRKKEKLSAKLISTRLGISKSQVQSWIYYKRTPWGKYNTKTIFNMDNWLDFYGWFLSEGWIGRNTSGKNKVHLCQNEGEYADLIRDCLTNLWGKFSEHYNDKQVIFSIYSTALSNYLLIHGKSHDKFIDKNIKNLPTEKLEVLLRSLLLGDGTDFRRYSTVSQKLRDDVLEIVLKCGYGANYSDEGRIYRVGISRTQRTPRIRVKPKRINYSGDVVGFEVKNNLVFVGRNGKFVWSGNSSFTACLAHMRKPKSQGGGGYTEEQAKRVCGKLQATLGEKK